MTTTIFLHGLESSGKGTKGSFLAFHFPQILCPDFFGSLDARLNQLSVLCGGKEDLVLIGSSFGGLMACCYAIANPDKVKRLVLMAPALNFEGFTPPEKTLDIPTLLVIGEDDEITPPLLVLPKAEKTFSNLEVILADDDHMLHNTFRELYWNEIIPAE